MFTLIHSNSEEFLNTQILSKKVAGLSNPDVHLWMINRNIYDDHKSYSEYFLDENEQSRAQKFRFKKDHDLFIIGRYITKILMAYYTNENPRNVKIEPDIYGKPTTNLNLFFNLSHSGDLLLLGVSNSPIGVDIEREDPQVDLESVGKSHFSEVEFQILMKAEKDKKCDTFFEIWTKKESLIKAIGKGLSIPLTSFNVTGRDGKVYWNFQAENIYGDWYVQKFEENHGYKSAFATQSSTVNLSCFRLEN